MQANEFVRLGIDPSQPGFYDQEEFVRREQSDPAFLHRYADHVRDRPYAPEYIQHARCVIAEATQYLHGRLKADGALGKCIDGSMVLLRMLERQWVWCAMLHGALTVDGLAGSAIGPIRFQPLMSANNTAKAGHAWLYAPPFVVVDVSVSLQPYDDATRKRLPSFVLAESPPRASYGLEDLMEDDARREFASIYRRHPQLSDVELLSPGITEDIERLGTAMVCHNEVTLRYVPVGVTAPDGPIERQRNLQLSGKWPIDLCREFERQVRPRRVTG